MPNMNSKLPVINQGARPKVLFLGNGINRNWNAPSWESVIEKCSERHNNPCEKEILKGLPSTMQIVAATNDSVDSSTKDVCTDLLALEPGAEEKEYIRALLDLPFDQIITTNYTHEIELTIDPDYSKGKSRGSTFYSIDKLNSKNDMMLHRVNCLNDKGMPRYIWHIHGDAFKPSSVIIGHYFYGRLLSQMRDYGSSVMRRYSAANSRNEAYEPQSWIDYFLLGDVYMLGYGMDFSEFDIWWVSCLKKRHFGENGIHFFGRSVDEQHKALMRAYSIECNSIEADSFDAFYKEALTILSAKVLETGGNS